MRALLRLAGESGVFYCLLDASSLHCPNCGAVVDPDARRCPYCQARLATVSCPSCFALLFDGAAYCPRCGVRRERAEQASEAAACAACGSALRRVQMGETTLLECERCDAVWMEAADFERLCADRESQAAVLHRFSGRAAVARGPVQYRKCVRCQKMMNRVNFARVSGTVVDVCRGHGTFLDAGELHAIVAFIQAGGLDRARERQIEDLKEQERRLRDVERRAASARGKADPHVSLGGTRGWDASAVTRLLEFLGKPDVKP